MEKSLFTPIKDKGLTTLRIQYDWRSDTSKIFAAKEWDKNLDFIRYNKDFYAESILTENAIFLNDVEARKMYEEYGLLEYLEQVIDLLRQGKHIGIECFYNAKYDIRYMCNIHSNTLGINNRSHAKRFGGIRRHGFEDKEIDVIIDGLNLSRAMSFKNVAADLPYGGCKTTVHMNPLELDNLDMMGFIAYALDRTRCSTGPDMGFPTEMSDVMNKHFSVQFTSGPNSPLGETGKPTSYGTYKALKQAAKFKYGSESLDGKVISIMGLGSVGYSMAEYLLKNEDVKLIVADINQASVEKLKKQYADRDIKSVTVDEILYTQADIFCPSAIGGIINEVNIPKLKFDIIFGAANNVLKASSREDEEKLAKMLAEKDILFQVAWWHNVGGVMCGAEEYNMQKGATIKGLEKKIDNTAPKKTWENLNKAKELGITPTECAYRTCEEKIYV